MKDYTLSEFQQNDRRVSNLIAIYEGSQGGRRQGRRSATSSDTLRAAVVFLHSALEEVFRNLFLWKLPAGSREALNLIPLNGTPANQRAKPFLLGDLLPYDGGFVHNVIRDSISAYVDHMNLNNVAELCSSLRMIDIDCAQFDAYFSGLAESMSRRHQIVHQMDRNHSSGTGNSRVQAISVRQVKVWQENTRGFVLSLVDVADRADRPGI